MGPRPEELERDIENARAQLRRDVDALVSRVSPQAVAHRQLEKAQGQVARVQQQVVDRWGQTAKLVRDRVGTRPAVIGLGAGVAVATLATVAWRIRAARR